MRGFATKFYTDEGNFDLVGNNIPVFFIQDAIKFPDLIHAVKPEPHNEIPQATTAHDTFWDFVVSTPETVHMVMWAMSDRAIPRSFRMMEGFGVNTFRFVSAEGKERFVKFHWKPLLGVHSLLRDEAQKLSGKDPDFHRRDLWDAIEQGNYPEFEFGVQMIEKEQASQFDFDILDPTKLWPEELAPVKIIGKMTLNRNVDNFFAETEQVAFCPANLVPGIDFSDDPLLQGRLFSYLDTQISRLGGPNFREIPINRPVVPVHNDERDGMHRMAIHGGVVSYKPNTLAQDAPATVPEAEGGFTHRGDLLHGRVQRSRGPGFRDHFRQATLFWNSMSEMEKEHIVDAFHYEAGSVKNKDIKQKVVDLFAHVSPDLAARIAPGLGGTAPANVAPNDVKAASPALSQQNTVKSPRTLKVAILLENGFCPTSLQAMETALQGAGAVAETVSNVMSAIQDKNGAPFTPNKDFTTVDAVFYDAVYIPGGDHIKHLMANSDAKNFIDECLHHAKTIGASDEALDLLAPPGPVDLFPDIGQAGNAPRINQGIVTVRNAADPAAYCNAFIGQLAMHRHWQRHH